MFVGVGNVNQQWIRYFILNTHLFLIRTEVILGNCRAIPGRERSEAFLSLTSDRPANKSPMPGGPGGAFEVNLAPPAIGW